MNNLLEPFVEPNLTTETDRAEEARYWERQRAIELAAEAQVREIEAEGAWLDAEREDEEPNPSPKDRSFGHHGTWGEE